MNLRHHVLKIVCFLTVHLSSVLKKTVSNLSKSSFPLFCWLLMWVVCNNCFYVSLNDQLWQSVSLWQTRPLNCGRWVRETRDQRDTTWKMRRDGSRTSPPSPLCRYTHRHKPMLTPTHTHLHTCTFILVSQICIRLSLDIGRLHCLPFVLMSSWSFPLFLPSFLPCLLLSM